MAGFDCILSFISCKTGAPGHVCGYTSEELVNPGIQLNFSPPFSPDLNPIERVWNIMKDWIQDGYGEGTTSGYRSLEAVCQDQLEELTVSMHDRCQAVTRTHTKY